MSSAKGKHVEVASARNRLGATLQNLVDQKDDGPSDSEEVTHPVLPTPRSSNSNSASPKKSPSKANRKRKRKDDLGSLRSGQPQHTYVMKLFDRSVDLAQFNEETPLYPVCRAWIKNDPQSKEPLVAPPVQRSPSPSQDIKPGSDDEMDRFPDVYELPPPIKQEKSDIHVDHRVPVPTPQPQEHLDIHSTNEGAPPEQLLINHMARWKETRNRWQITGLKNEMRYADSMCILKQMYDRQCQK
ncbi:hypothetical protein LOTGIDRAFT_228731 [Lottia gigantea]|uniref:Lin-37 DREAM MuvB core complex component n=1 Tax=Lottia gigantea TaxID=225164 RepID=V4ACZ4_LOTGI|nr:hypothetical protein LOTGIDRAFT_228731 [Lottia gigantea]ESO91201.1 hypothetical protein LOTGIDRAFT_228731 [Lottia gigantea]